MATETQTQVESSPTQSHIVENLSDAQRSEWLKSGKLPEPETEDSAPPSSDKTAAPEEKTPEELAESATAKEQESEESKLSEKGQRRFKQLLSRNKELEEEISKLKAPKEEKVERAPKPKLTAYSTIEEYETAMDEWMQKEVEFKAQETLSKERADKEKADKEAAVEAQNKKIEKEWREKVTASTKKHPDFLEVASKAPLIEKSIADAFILDSAIGPELLYHFGANPEELERINEIESKLAQARELTKLELKLSESPASGPKKVSSAPKPPSEVGARGTPVDDVVESALANKDFETYQREANARERKARA